MTPPDYGFADVWQAMTNDQRRCEVLQAEVARRGLVLAVRLAQLREALGRLATPPARPAADEKDRP